MKPEPPAEDALPVRPLEPPEPGERQVMKWFGALMGVTIISAGWLAARADSPVGVRQALDTILQVGLAGLFLAGAYRLLSYYPYRLLDLVTMVLTLSLGVKATLDALPPFLSFVTEGQGPKAPQFGPMVLGCMLTSSVLLSGAALGLRYCSRLKVETSGARILTIMYGMTAFPSGVGCFAFPAVILSTLVDPQANNEMALVYLGLFVVSLFVAARNAVLLFRSMSLDDEVPANRTEE